MHAYTRISLFYLLLIINIYFCILTFLIGKNITKKNLQPKYAQFNKLFHDINIIAYIKQKQLR